MLGVPFAWLGYRGDPLLAPRRPRALTALGPRLHQVRADPLDPPGRGRQRPRHAASCPAGQGFPPSRRPRRSGRWSANSTCAWRTSSPTSANRSQLPPSRRFTGPARRHGRGGGGSRCSVPDREGVPQGHRCLLPRRTRHRGPRAVLPPPPPHGRDRPFRGRGDGELDLRLETSSAAEFAANTAKDEGFVCTRCTVPVLAPRHDAWMGGRHPPRAISRPSRLLATTASSSANASCVCSSSMRSATATSTRTCTRGNLKIAADGDIIALDFGIMGRLDDYTRRVYAEILLGFIRKDYRRVAEVHFEAGYVPADRDIDEFAAPLRSVGEPIFGMDASRISMARLLTYLFEVTERSGRRLGRNSSSSSGRWWWSRASLALSTPTSTSGKSRVLWSRLHPPQHRAARTPERPGPDGAGPWALRPEAARDRRGPPRPAQPGAGAAGPGAPLSRCSGPRRECDHRGPRYGSALSSEAPEVALDAPIVVRRRSVSSVLGLDRAVCPSSGCHKSGGREAPDSGHLPAGTVTPPSVTRERPRGACPDLVHAGIVVRQGRSSPRFPRS